VELFFWCPKVLPLFKLLRPHHWAKNVFCLAGVLFGDRLGDPHALTNAGLIFAAFCLLCSSVYILNDLIDVHRDRRHPTKRTRPIASGAVSPATACIASLALFIGAFTILFVWVPSALLVAGLYVLINIAYTGFLKHVPILDFFCIAAGFVLRMLAGVYGIGDVPTGWIFICTLSLALLLAQAKRRSELVALGTAGLEELNERRPVLRFYSKEFLDSLINSSATITIIAYALFTITSGKNPALVLTVPFVYYATMRYKMLVMVTNDGEEPERLLLRDVSILVSAGAWLIAFLWITHSNLEIFRI